MKKRHFSITAGIDVHRDTVVVTVRHHRDGDEDTLETKTFETFRDSLVEMTKWLVEQSVEVVGLESTGVYWRPVVRVLHESAQQLMVWLINPLDVKRGGRGRKTDVKDSRRISELVMYGMVNPSYLASREQEELRLLTRHRAKLIADQTRYKNRIIKGLEASGVKLASVLSDCFGVSGRAMIEALLDEKAPEAVAQLARGVARRNINRLTRAAQGGFTPSTQLVLRQNFKLLDLVDEQLRQIEAQIETLAAPLKADRELLNTIPGVDDTSSAAILAETGSDMSVFPTAKHCTAWTGLSPGSEESAGKSKSAPARKGNKYLRTALVQSAWSAVRTNGSIYQTAFRRLASRLGPKKAIVAIARKMLTAAYHMLRDRRPFTPPDQLPTPERVRDRLRRRYMKALENLGFHVAPTTADPTVS
jgi:transposase